MLPPLDEVLVRIYDDAVGGDLFRNIGVTLYRALAGFFDRGARRRRCWAQRCRGARWRGGSSIP